MKKERTHEHVYVVDGDRAVCGTCGFSVLAHLVVCVGCGKPNVTSWRVFSGGVGPFCSVACRDVSLQSEAAHG